jgi:hypothetical protein
MQSRANQIWYQRPGRRFLENQNWILEFSLDDHTEKNDDSAHSIPRQKTIFFVPIWIPTAGHLPLLYVMGYDTRPHFNNARKI